MTQALILQNVAHEGPGRILPALRDQGISVDIRKLFQGDEVPADTDALLVVVMGGPMGVNDADFKQFPFLAQEFDLLKKRVAKDQGVLGICLGAQLLASAGGGKVYPNINPKTNEKIGEIGFAPINLPFPGGTEPILHGVRDGALMFHWHFDTFDLPKLPPPATSTPTPTPPPTGNALLATTPQCKNQAYRFKSRLWGFQFHFEMTRDGIEAMIAHAAEDWRKVLGDAGDVKIRSDADQYFDEYERTGNAILRNLLKGLKRG